MIDYSLKVLLMLVLVALPLNAGSVDEFRWKKRLLVVTDSSAVVEPKLEAAKKGLDERDVVVFYLDGKPEHGGHPDVKLERELRSRLKIDDHVGEVLLLGKDGRTILRWKTEKFSTKKLFSEIDVMPMRKDEM